MCATNASRLRMWCSMHNESKLRGDGLVQSTALEMIVSSQMKESKARVLATWMRGIEGAQDFAARHGRSGGGLFRYGKAPASKINKRK